MNKYGYKEEFGEVSRPDCPYEMAGMRLLLSMWNPPHWIHLEDVVQMHVLQVATRVGGGSFLQTSMIKKSLR